MAEICVKKKCGEQSPPLVAKKERLRIELAKGGPSTPCALRGKGREHDETPEQRRDEFSLPHRGGVSGKRRRPVDAFSIETRQVFENVSSRGRLDEQSKGVIRWLQPEWISESERDEAVI